MEKKYEQLLNKLERELENFVELPQLERMRSELDAVRNGLSNLYNVVEASDTSAEADVIEFFKHIKPRFYSLMILSVERYGFEMARPLRKGKRMDVFYNSQLDYISRFFDQHAFFYQYFKMGATELDTLYFVPDAAPVGLIGADLPHLDQRFGTMGDYLFTKFIALEKLRELVVLEMEVPSAA